MAGRTIKEPSGSGGRSPRGSSPGKPVMNLVIMLLAFFFFGRLGVSRGWIVWPPSNLAQMLAAFAGWVAIAGPFVLFRSEDASGGMGLGDRVWMTTGVVIWIRFLLQLLSGRLPAWNEMATSVSVTDLSVLAAACIVGGSLTRPRQMHWTWTNIMGWTIALAWLASATFQRNTGLMSLVLR